MSLNEAISLPSLRQKLEEGGFQTIEQLLASSVKEIAAGKTLLANSFHVY